jgi:hypothetical protein
VNAVANTKIALAALAAPVLVASGPAWTCALRCRLTSRAARDTARRAFAAGAPVVNHGFQSYAQQAREFVHA